MIRTVGQVISHILTYRKRKILERKLGCKFKELKQNIVSYTTIKTKDRIRSSRLFDFGGVNNLGMFVHFSESGKRIAITKIQKSSLADREVRFLKWQEEYFKKKLTAQYFESKKISKTQYSWVSFEPLLSIKRYSNKSIRELYQSLDVEKKVLQELSLDRSLQSLVQEIEADTKIKAILRNVVCDFPSPESISYLNNFFNERKVFFIRHEVEYKKIIKLFSVLQEWEGSKEISDMYGLVHGDFKKQNIMSSHAGEYKVIDLQYYTYGIRLWDLAFYYSKCNLTLQYILIDIIPIYSLTEKEKFVFTLFFSIAASLHLKKRTAIETIDKRIKPAIDYCYDSSCAQILMRKL